MRAQINLIDLIERSLKQAHDYLHKNKAKQARFGIVNVETPADYDERKV